MSDYDVVLSRSGVTAEVRESTNGEPDVLIIVLGFMGANAAQLRKFSGGWCVLRDYGDLSACLF